MVFVTTLFGVVIFRRWSLQREMLDIPNERSSHSIPTPRGGGAIICLVCLTTFLVYLYLSSGKIYWAYIIGAMIVSLISMIDDLCTISAFWRFLCHGLAAGLVIWSVGGFETLFVPFYGIIQIGFFGKVIAFLWIVWLINAYNFMDGIDGIAATQAITAGMGWYFVGLLYNFEDIGFYGGVLAFSAFAFLIPNWQPAKIFMGDVGSAFLGYSFAILPLLSIKRIENPLGAAYLPWIAVWLVWFFVFDSMITFLKRLFRGEKVWQAHREHIYQQLMIAGFSHQFVTLLYGTLSILPILILIVSLKYPDNYNKYVLFCICAETILLCIFRFKRSYFAGLIYGHQQKSLK
ncbi:MAG: glycosyltransferase family 4 protein [Actinomycetota bacterium]